MGYALAILRRAPRCPWAVRRSARPAAWSLILMGFVPPGGIEKLAAPMISVLAFFPFLGLLFTVSVTLPTQVAVPLQLSFTVATSPRTPRLDPSSLTVAVAGVGGAGAGWGGGVEAAAGGVAAGTGVEPPVQLDARPVPVAVIFPIRPS